MSSSPRSSLGLVKPCWAVKFVNLCPSSLAIRYVSGKSVSDSSNFFTYWNLLLAMFNDQGRHTGTGQAQLAADMRPNLADLVGNVISPDQNATWKSLKP